ncbi:uncharacterized protein LOC133714152 isoform X1 [Rosa rugosa]|uniref:uncharacterized protein LOC133714152 isoform X1 n=3 Tax=Rosa rugosa TaxID=74645 RepID=UPI002B40A8F7|nr:uncharacterized protein LOC133714152 isoform X1 [Rosa rugosa]XP_061996206.1 uncharacterized protein LOC133714152 isoform X1 [Rosa rugosa]XP_061996207.1 uncharacterized protein LOC133714152 isoform X1 [Rosa rugosa]XP_061996208.1 uncharacterized protein LOC133714152 isoform X1 [Rosa rugosa]XP_061996209.1 uncharacterized protein LOC133714152 isoform X1 [Rosa rugosa]
MDLIEEKRSQDVFFYFLFFIEIHPQRLMDKMEQPRARDRQRRQPMSSSQQQTYLARRRAIAQGKRPMVETSSSNITKQAAGKVRNRCPQQKKKFQRDEGFRRRVSVFSSGWRMGQSVKMNTAYLSELILKEWKKKKHAHWRYKNARRDLMTQDIYQIKRTWRKVLRIRRRKHREQNNFLAKFYIKRFEEFKHNIKNSSNNWSMGVAIRKLSNFMFEQRRLTNGWLRWS